MEEKKSSGRGKRPAKDDDAGKWDCSVCTFKNPLEAFKCEICDVRKGTSTRKPRINPQVVAQQVAQQFTPPPPPPKKEKIAAPKKERSSSTNSNESSSSRVSERDRSESPDLEKPNTSSKDASKDSKEKETKEKEPKEKEPKEKSSTGKPRKTKPKLKNIDRSSAQHIAVTVNNITVIITDFKPKKPASAASAHSGGNKSSTDYKDEVAGTAVKQEQQGD